MLTTATNRRIQQKFIPTPPAGSSEAELQLRKDVIRQNNLDRMYESEDKVNAKRIYREQERIRREREIEESLLKAETDRAMKLETKHREETLAQELERYKLDLLRETKMRQQLRETSYELRELEAKLKEAYVAKERHAQMAEKEAHKFDSLLEDAQIMKRMKEEAERAEQNQKLIDQNKKIEMRQYKQDLHKQLEEKENNKQKSYEEFLKEKLLIDEIVRKIHEEDQKEFERKLLAQKATREYIEEFKKQREIWKQQERETMEAENRKIMEYSKIQKERDDNQKANKKAREEAVEKVQNRLFGQIEKEREAREEMERIRQELYLEEQEEVVRNHERNELERKIRQRLDLQKQYEEQMQFKSMRQNAEKEEEERIKQQMLDKFAADDKIEQMNAQKRRMKQLDHKRMVETLLEERRQRMNMEKQRELDERVLNDKLDAYRRQIIEEERVKLLQEHATKLLGYLPKGVIRDSKDLDALGDDFKKQFKRRQVDFFSDEGWTK
ncbi:unnamed protein product [Brachionus calyciflorus]|uniref:Meiosis-specific nuclear structural protein 1 n=1 Tax=Brachionus calyciflorus TaxID=104777 RepID=A0A813M2M4_9BILA|nr:unnamed protein product [Brachionus calyciflorus]